MELCSSYTNEPWICRNNPFQNYVCESIIHEGQVRNFQYLDFSMNENKYDYCNTLTFVTFVNGVNNISY